MLQSQVENHYTSIQSNPASTNLDLLLASYDYELPTELIAQNPVPDRDSSRLLVVDSPSSYTHSIFRDLSKFLHPEDLLVLNNTRVIPARLYGRKPTGAMVEVLLLEEQQPNYWLALVKPGRRLPLGAKIIFAMDVTATVMAKDPATGGRWLQFELPEGINLLECLEQLGQMPLPPYITASQAEMSQYQTVYAERPGAIAAPTAGLHFTPALLSQLAAAGIAQVTVTLHVGVGTFRPVEVADITTHQMHSEWVEVPIATVEKIRETKARGGRVIAVGTTVARSLEGAAIGGELESYTGKTDIFIYPGYQWRVIDGLITNFHLPRSSLLMLVSALIGRQRLLNLYQEAIAQKYRFYSFGDAMLILPEARNGEWRIEQ